MELLKEKLQGRRLILASRSPRRQELLAGTGLDFVPADSCGAEEVWPAQLPAAEVPEYLAVWKSNGYPHELGANDVLITADTVVVCDGRIFGKPGGRDGAVAMLAELSGRRHTVVTGVALRAPGRMRSFSVSSDVWFRPLAAEEIAYYVDTYRPYDKAGSYGIQEWIGYVAIERIEGSFYNVMGLPVQTLYAELGRFADSL
ncbi:MAG TPA: septum formation protein Maf [Candidatus Tidjanibacter gallistercoris]|nr:septum formation protein Maf [Candidatus Tidjanibacter gallistercoris]